MRRETLWQYILLGIAWLLAIIALPLPGASLNGFLGWNGEVSTAFFIRFLLLAPREIYHDRRSLAASVELPTAVELLWLAAVLVGLILFVFSPTFIRRTQLWRAPTQRILRIVASLLLILPAALFLPNSMHLPRPMTGMVLLAAAHVALYAALLLTPARPTSTRAFTIETPT